MSDVPTWTLFAYMNGDAEGKHDERRSIAPWQLHHCLDWCADRGYDNIYFYRDQTKTTRFEKAEKGGLGRHHMHVVEGSQHESGDEAA